MKTLYLKWHEDYGPLDGISYEGTQLAENLGAKLASVFHAGSIAFYSSEADRTFTTAKHVVLGAGLEGCEVSRQPLLNEGLELDSALQGLGTFIPGDLDIAFCVTHNPVIYNLREHFAAHGVTPSSGFYERPYHYDAYTFFDWSDMPLNPPQA